MVFGCWKKEKMKLGFWKKEAVPLAAMVFVETGEVVMTLLYKKAMNKGMSPFVSVAYYNILALLILLPHFLFQTLTSRSTEERPPLTLALIWRFFVLGLFGKALALFAYLGTDLSGPTLTAALANLTPIFTFLIAFIFRMENMYMRSPITQAKSLGATVAVAGAFVITVYKGPEIMFKSLTPGSAPHLVLMSSQSNWVLGSLWLSIAFFFNAAWGVLQAKTVKEYPDKPTVVFYFVLFGTLQCTIVALIVERSPTAWIMHYNIEIIAILFSAIFGTAIRFNVLTFCLDERGPLYVAMFKPLGMIIAEIGGILFLGDVLHLGSVIGAIIIAIGFYTVLWGQAKESNQVDSKMALDLSQSSTQDAQAPLLQSHHIEEA